MREILVIARQFPPYEKLGAVVRIIKFCKYLPEHGFKPVVVTVHKEPSVPIDPAQIPLLDEIAKSCEFHYVPESTFVRFIEELYSRRKKLKKARHRSFNQILACSFYGLLKGMVSAVYRPIRKRYVIPDEGIFWNRRATATCANLIEKRAIRYLLTTSPVNSTHLIGLALKARFDITWCADFRDAWAGNPLFKTRYERRNREEERLCRQVLKAADIVVSVNEPIVELLKRHTDAPHEKRFATIYNGYDPEEIRVEAARLDRSRINIIHCGVLNNERNMGPFLTALAETVDLGRPFRLHLLGETTESHCLRFQEMRPDLVRIEGVVPRPRTMAMLKGADVALLINSARHYAALSGKIFEYLGCDKRVIGLVPEGIARDFIRRYSMGWSCDLHDVDAIKGILEEIHRLWNQGRLETRYDQTVKNSFDRRVLTAHLARLIAAP